MKSWQCQQTAIPERGEQSAALSKHHPKADCMMKPLHTPD